MTLSFPANPQKETSKQQNGGTQISTRVSPINQWADSTRLKVRTPKRTHHTKRHKTRAIKTQEETKRLINPCPLSPYLQAVATKAKDNVMKVRWIKFANED